jgi:hypothetical protein
MVKILGFRITPFFMFILGMECLALLISVYVGLLLFFNDSPILISFQLMDHSFYMTLLLMILISILTPGFFYQTQVINKINRTITEKRMGFFAAFLAMTIIVLTSNLQVDAKTFFMGILLSACVGLIINNASVLGKYWRFLVRTGVN